MNRIVWDRRGFTTAELLVAALFGMIVMATLYGFFREQMFNLLSQETKTATREDTRGGLDLMVRELRNSGSWGSGTQPASCERVASATSTKVQIQADLDGNGNCSSATGEDVTYELTGSTITRNGSSHPLVDNVVLPSGSSFLTYYKSDNTSFTPANTSADRALIKRVKITFAVEVPDPTPDGKTAGRMIRSTLSSSVVFRN